MSFISDAHSFAAKIFEVFLSSELHLFYNLLPPLTCWKLDLVYGRVTIQEDDALSSKRSDRKSYLLYLCGIVYINH